MKKIYYFVLLFCLFSCNEDEFRSMEKSVENGESVDNSELETRAGSGDGMYDLLGFSYDVTGDYLSVDEARLSVIDIAAFVADNRGRFYDPSTTVGNTVFYSGATAEDYIEEINAKSSVTVGGNVAEKAFSGSVTQKYESSHKYEYSTKYSFSHADLIKRVKRLYLDANAGLLSKYLTPTFKQNLSSLSPDAFVKKYGTHVLTDISIGGRLRFTYRSSITKESTREQKKSIVEGGVKFSIGKFGADVNNSHELEYIKTLNKENASWNFEVEYIGGTNSGISLSFNSQTGYPSTSFDLKGWESSVTDRNSGLTDIAWDKAYPIYELITDSGKKAQIKAAVERYIASKKIEVMKLVPLYRYHNTKTKSHVFIANWDELGAGKDSWQYEFVACYVLPEKINGSVPLYRYFNTKTKSHVFIANWDELGAGKDRWQYEFIACYVHPKQIEGTVPLYRYYNTKTGTHVFIANWDELGAGKDSWQYEFVACYVYP